MILRLRELVLLLLPLKIRGVLLFSLRGGVFLFQSYGCSVVVLYFSYGKLCVF